MLKEPLILIVYGATGFTVQLVATSLDKHLELCGKRCASVGRTQSKLGELSAKLERRPEILCATLEDSDAVTSVVSLPLSVLNR